VIFAGNHLLQLYFFVGMFWHNCYTVHKLVD